MLTKMNNRAIENWFSWVCGIFGGGVTITITPTAFEASVKIALFIIASIAGGYLGMFGKYLFNWTIRKIFKTKNDERID